jgi:hypothetical protein
MLTGFLSYLLAPEEPPVYSIYEICDLTPEESPNTFEI